MRNQNRHAMECETAGELQAVTSRQAFRFANRFVLGIVSTFRRQPRQDTLFLFTAPFAMPFALLPVLAAMHAVYQEPPLTVRFQAYLRLLQGGTPADLAVPVQHFNPMAKAALITCLEELLTTRAEQVVANTLPSLNASASIDEPLLHVALNLADDAHGGWTNRYTTDFANKFQLRATLKRGFCTPIVWSSEVVTPDLLVRRTQAQAWRSRYHLLHPAPRTLAEHVAQETYVARQLGTPPMVPTPTALAAYQLHHSAIDTATLLAFFYGDEVARQLGYQPLGNLAHGAGFELARALASGTVNNGGC